MMAVEGKTKPVKREWLKKIRKEWNITAETAAEWSGITRGHYSMIENGLKNPSMKVAVVMGAALNFDPLYFYQEEVEKRKGELRNGR